MTIVLRTSYNYEAEITVIIKHENQDHRQTFFLNGFIAGAGLAEVYLLVLSEL